MFKFILCCMVAVVIAISLRPEWNEVRGSEEKNTVVVDSETSVLSTSTSIPTPTPSVAAPVVLRAKKPKSPGTLVPIPKGSTLEDELNSVTIVAPQ